VTGSGHQGIGSGCCQSWSSPGRRCRRCHVGGRGRRRGRRRGSCRATLRLPGLWPVPLQPPPGSPAKPHGARRSLALLACRSLCRRAAHPRAEARCRHPGEPHGLAGGGVAGEGREGGGRQLVSGPPESSSWEATRGREWLCLQLWHPLSK